MQKQVSLNQENWLKIHSDKIHSLVESKDLQTIYKKFKNTDIEDQKWLKNRDNFFKGSPSSAGVICEQLRRGEGMSFKRGF